jgi:hypothetical protein
LVWHVRHSCPKGFGCAPAVRLGITTPQSSATWGAPSESLASAVRRLQFHDAIVNSD